MPKLNYSWKHGGQKKVTIANVSVAIKDLYVLKTNQTCGQSKALCAKGYGLFLAIDK